MLSVRLFCAAILLSGVVVTMMGCGESGSEPAVIPEMRIDVAGGAPNPNPNPIATPAPVEFTIAQLVAGDEIYQSLAGRTLLAPLSIFLEGAPGPYSAMLAQTPLQLADGPIEVNLLQLGGPSVGPVSTSATSLTVTVALFAPTPIVSATTANPEVRFELCAPVFGSGSCSITDPVTSFSQIPVSGSIGDAFATRLFGQASSADPQVRTPLVVFFHNPRFQIAGVFRSGNGGLLQAQLFVNGELRETATAGNSDVVVRTDL